MKLHLMANK